MKGFPITLCRVCQRKIPKERLEALPGVDTCVDHSSAKAKTVDDVETCGSDHRDLLRSNQSTSRGDR